MWGKNSYIKDNFLPRLLLHAEVPAGRRGGSSRWRRPNSRTRMRHLGLPPSLGDMDGWGLPQQLDCGGCHVLPPAPAWRSTRGHGMHPNRPACSCPRGSGLLQSINDHPYTRELAWPWKLPGHGAWRAKSQEMAVRAPHLTIFDRVGKRFGVVYYNENYTCLFGLKRRVQ